MATFGMFQVRPNPSPAGGTTYDVIWRSSAAPFEYALIFGALDEEDATMRCERLNAALKD